jgi:hypothetical protein
MLSDRLKASVVLWWMLVATLGLLDGFQHNAAQIGFLISLVPMYVVFGYEGWTRYRWKFAALIGGIILLACFTSYVLVRIAV